MSKVIKEKMRLKSDQIKIRHLDKKNPAHEIAIKVKRGKIEPNSIFTFMK